MTDLDSDTAYVLICAYSITLGWAALILAIRAGGMTGFTDGLAVAAVVPPALAIIGGLVGRLK